MSARGFRTDLLVVLASLLPLGLFLLRERGIAGSPGLPLDDSWIHLHFARNIAEGAGFSYNPGVPVAGSTAPLWTLLLALAVAAFGATLATVKALGIAVAIGAALVTRRAAISWGAPPAVALAAGVALAWSGPVVWGALSGMEVPLAALLVALALAAHARDWPGRTAALAALATLARPEALLLVPLLALARPLTVRRAVVFAVVTVVVLAPAVAFNLATVGAPVPATAAAKVEGGLLGWLSGVREPLALTLIGRPWAFFREWVGWLVSTSWLLPFALLVAIPIAWVRTGRLLGFPAAALIAHPLAMALLAPYRGPGFQEGRYSIHLLPVAMVVVAAMARGRGKPRALGTPLARRLPPPARIAVVAFLAAAVVGLIPAADRYAWGVQNINAMQVHLGRWVDAHVPRPARLAVNDVGAIAYFSRREVIDLMGLVTPEIIPYRREGERGVIRYVIEKCPDYVIVFPAWFPELSARADLLEPVYRVRLERNEVSGGPEMVVYRLTRCAV
ncbi:MAG: hypothetical protein HY727_15740 [Candidatus Rokubacteria bacterium]|nr:hypothetical protein [Candidatus Rokubacteria bacterium]